MHLLNSTQNAKNGLPNVKFFCNLGKSCSSRAGELNGEGCVGMCWGMNSFGPSRFFRPEGLRISKNSC